MRARDWHEIIWAVLFAGSLMGLVFVSFAPIDFSTPRTVLGLTPLPAPRQTIDPWALYGVASWYGKPFHGRPTASGAIYDMGGYSVAHRTLPMGTFIVVQNLDNGRWCVAVVNDRGPYVKGRDWDVSAAVAKRLGMVWHGVVPVKVRIINGY